MAPPASALVGHHAAAAERLLDLAAHTPALPAIPRPSINLVACASAAARTMGRIRQLATAALGWQVALSAAPPPVSELQQQEIGPLAGAEGRRGAVASENAICTRVGIELMERGGNAADALVATTLCVGVIGMYHSGIGGGG